MGFSSPGPWRFALLNNRRSSNLARYWRLEPVSSHIGLQPFLTQPGALSSTPQLQTAVRDLSTRALARVTVIALDGRVLADSAVSDHLLSTLENQLTRPEIQHAVATGRGTDLLASHTTGERTLYLAVGLSGANQATSIGFLRLGLPMTTFDREVAKLHRDLALAFGIAFLIAIALSVWLARRHHKTSVGYCDCGATVWQRVTMRDAFEPDRGMKSVSWPTHSTT